MPSVVSARGLDPIATNQLARLGVVHPAAASCLSDLGQRIFYPRGVTAQAADAAGCWLNATVGQITDGHGHAVPLPTITDSLGTLTAEDVVLYASQGGQRALRLAWQARLKALGGRVSLPVVTCGITHALSTVADLFLGPDATILVPAPCWGNYQHIFGRRAGARTIGYPLIADGGLDLEGIDRSIQSLEGPAVLMFNFPSNPVGYSPTDAEAAALVDSVARSPVPLVVVCDDAYLGMDWEPEIHNRSLFHALSMLDARRVLAVKLDGATKELFFFGGRVGFITFGCEGEAAAILEDKAIGSGRASVSSAPTSSQALVLKMLEDPEMPTAQRALRDEIRARYAALKEGLAAAGVEAWPFNSAFFALIPVVGDAHAARRALLKQGVGVIAEPSVGAIRVSYASVHLDDIPRLVEHIAPFCR